MNKNLKIWSIGIALVLGMSACVNDLNVTPIDPSTVQTPDQTALFNKIYATFALTGQNGPDGNGDVDGIDEGVSSLYRMVFELNELPTDEGWWNWSSDDGINQIYNLTWTSSNSLVTGLYYRLYFDITLCNHFLELYGENTDEISIAQCVEARWVRALNYYYLLDMFQNVPFTTAVTTEAPKQMQRADLFTWLETELKEVADLLPNDGAKITEYRVDEVAAWMLLMRMYLNAEVYIGTEHYNEAAEYANKIINSSYGQAVPDITYAEMFMGNNNKRQNPTAAGEFIFAISQDGVQTQSWGGSRFLVNATRDAGNLPSGSDDSWSCFRSSPTLFIGPWFTQEEALKVGNDPAWSDANGLADEYFIPTLVGDDRCMLCQSCDNTDPNDTILTTFDCDLSTILARNNKAGDNGATFPDCWTICKWTGVYSTGETVGNNTSFPDTDIPFMRASEAYLTYAEAVYRGGAAVGTTALEAINVLRTRAHATPLATLTDDEFCNEWLREFYCEGRRRVDLVRFGRFTSNDYLWEGKLNGVDDRFNVFPLPYSDLTANDNLEQYLNY